MTLEEILYPPNMPDSEPWQLGYGVSTNIAVGGVTFIFCSDNRGNGGDSARIDFTPIRKTLYSLAKHEISIPIADLGDIISGKSLEDTHYLVEELLLKCLENQSLPVVVGGGADLSLAIYQAVSQVHNKLVYAHIDSKIILDPVENSISERNFLTRILSNKTSLEQLYHLGYQRHLNEKASVDFLEEMDAELVSLSGMMGDTGRIEPFLRKANVVTLSADVAESQFFIASRHPQVNGLNPRELCSLFKEIGMGQKLSAFGIFNTSIQLEQPIYQQLIAQSLWYFLEGIVIQKSHPKETSYETYVVMVDHHYYHFKRGIFTNLWYFGEKEDVEDCLPCTEQDYRAATQGILSPRLVRFLNR